MLLFLIIPEALASVLTLISPVIPNSVILVFAFIAIAKLALTLRLDIDTDHHTVLLQIAVSLFFDTGILLRFLACEISSISELKKSFFCAFCGILLGCIISKFIYTVISKQSTPQALVTWSIIAACVFHAAICTVFFIKNTGLGDGSISVLKFTFQLPELFKLELVIITFIVSELVKTKYTYVLLLYFASVLSIGTLIFVFKEQGTALLLIYFTLLAGVNLSTGDAKYKSRIWNFITSKIFPLSIGSLFFLGVGILKRILFIRYPTRGEQGEYLYGFNEKLFNISSRLLADSAQIQSARESLYASQPVNLQLNTKLSIPNAKADTALSDFGYVCVAQALGKWIAPLIFLLFSVLLVITVSRKGNVLAKAAVTIILCQIFVSVSGILLYFCYTGITTPFLSQSGGSSILSSFSLLTIILMSMRRKAK